MGNKNISEKLDELEAEINKAKEDKSKLEGMLETLLTQMEERFGVSTIEEAKTLLEDIKKKMEKADKELTEGYNSLKEEYEW